MKRKANQRNLILIGLAVLIVLLLLQQPDARIDPLILLNRIGITSRDLIAAAIGAVVMYLFMKQR